MYWSPKSALAETRALGLGLVKERPPGLPDFRSSPCSGKAQSLLGQRPLPPLLPGFQGPGLLLGGFRFPHYRPTSYFFTQTKLGFSEKIDYEFPERHCPAPPAKFFNLAHGPSSLRGSDVSLTPPTSAPPGILLQPRQQSGWFRGRPCLTQPGSFWLDDLTQVTHQR